MAPKKEFIMHIFRTLSLSLAALLLTTCSEFDPNNQPASLSEASIAPAANAVRVTGNDIAGSVTSSNGPEAGVWVIAETRDLETLYSKTVVTDDQDNFTEQGVQESLEDSGKSLEENEVLNEENNDDDSDNDDDVDDEAVTFIATSLEVK